MDLMSMHYEGRHSKILVTGITLVHFLFGFMVWNAMLMMLMILMLHVPWGVLFTRTHVLIRLVSKRSMKIVVRILFSQELKCSRIQDLKSLEFGSCLLLTMLPFSLPQSSDEGLSAPSPLSWQSDSYRSLSQVSLTCHWTFHYLLL